MEFFRSDLVFLDVDIKSSDDLFDYIADITEAKGMVTTDFRSKIKEREANYPTGLQTESIGIAIPHTDPDYIVEPFVAVVRPQVAVDFAPMGMAEGQVSAQLIFVLGVKGDGQQVEMLGNLMGLMMDDIVVKALMDTDDVNEIVAIIKRKFEEK